MVSSRQQIRLYSAPGKYAIFSSCLGQLAPKNKKKAPMNSIHEIQYLRLDSALPNWAHTKRQMWEQLSGQLHAHSYIVVATAVLPSTVYVRHSSTSYLRYGIRCSHTRIIFTKRRSAYSSDVTQNVKEESEAFFSCHPIGIIRNAKEGDNFTDYYIETIWKLTEGALSSSFVFVLFERERDSETVWVCVESCAIHLEFRATTDHQH